MFLHVSSSGVTLCDPDDFKRFKVTTGEPTELADLAPKGIEVDEGLCWVAVVLIKRLGPSDDTAWLAAVDKMVAGAAKFGWTSADQEKVRAHVERSDAP